MTREPKKISELLESLGQEVDDNFVMTGLDLTKTIEQQNRKFTRSNLLYLRSGWTIPSSAIGLVADGITDNSLLLQQAIDVIVAAGINNNRRITFLIDGGYNNQGFRFDNSVDLGSNMELVFKSDVKAGKRCQFRIFGEIDEKPEIATLRADAPAGATLLEINNSINVSNFFIVGDKLTIRGENDVNNKAFQREEVYVTSIDSVNNNIGIQNQKARFH